MKYRMRILEKDAFENMVVVLDPIEEKWDEEKVGEFIKEVFLSWKGIEDLNKFAKKLIAAGLRVEDWDRPEKIEENNQKDGRTAGSIIRNY